MSRRTESNRYGKDFFGAVNMFVYTVQDVNCNTLSPVNKRACRGRSDASALVYRPAGTRNCLALSMKRRRVVDKSLASLSLLLSPPFQICFLPPRVRSKAALTSRVFRISTTKNLYFDVFYTLPIKYSVAFMMKLENPLFFILVSFHFFTPPAHAEFSSDVFLPSFGRFRFSGPSKSCRAQFKTRPRRWEVRKLPKIIEFSSK